MLFWKFLTYFLFFRLLKRRAEAGEEDPGAGLHHAGGHDPSQRDPSLALDPSLEGRIPNPAPDPSQEGLAPDPRGRIPRAGPDPGARTQSLDPREETPSLGLDPKEGIPSLDPDPSQGTEVDLSLDQEADQPREKENQDPGPSLRTGDQGLDLEASLSRKTSPDQDPGPDPALDLDQMIEKDPSLDHALDPDQHHAETRDPDQEVLRVAGRR